MRKAWGIVVGLVVVVCVGFAPVDPPVTVAVTVTAGNVRLTGDVIAADETSVTLRVRDGERTLAWTELTPASAFTARMRTLRPETAEQWLDLGEFGWSLGLRPQAERAFVEAVKLDPGLDARVREIRASAAGGARPPRDAPAAPEPPADDSEADEPETSKAPEGLFPGGDGELLTPAPPAGSVVRFEPVTPSQHQAAIARYRDTARNELTRLGVRARELQTPHFMIFTDWDPVDDRFLMQSLEDAYRLVAREFDVPPGENVFVGKLPVYMFDSHAMMLRYAREIDRQSAVGESVAGYYVGRSDGMGKLVMSKPRATRDVGLDQARRMWARTLTHEFTHAFVARYRSNAFVPRWLNEGMAELVSELVHPRPRAAETAYRVAREGTSIARLFDDRHFPGAEMYPVMMTLVQALYDEDPRKFNRYFDAIKAGRDPEQTLKELYGVDYAGLEEAWRTLMIRSSGRGNRQPQRR